MKALDNFLAKIGHDKFDHHILGALICALISIVSILQDGVLDWSAVGYPCIGAIAVFIVSVVKEYGFDDYVDWMDIVWAMLGCLWVFAAVAIGILFYPA